MKILFLLLVLYFVNSNGQTFNTQELSVNSEDWVLLALHQRCGGGTYVIGADKGSGNANTRTACIDKCQSTPGCEFIGYRGSASNRCNYYDSSCNVFTPFDVGTEVVDNSNTEDEIWVLRSELPDELLMEYHFRDKISDRRCTTAGRITTGKGTNNRNTPEDCARSCFEDYNDCISFSWQIQGGSETTKRCLFNNRGCRDVHSTSAAYDVHSSYEMYLMGGLKWLPTSLQTEVQSRFDGNHFNEFMLGTSCGGKQITYSSDTDRKEYAQLKCGTGSETSFEGLVYETGYDYMTAVHDIDDCGQLCYDWNYNSSNTKECRSFNMKTDPGDSTSFKCMLFECGMFLNQGELRLISYNPSDTDTINDKWGYIDDWNTPHCRGHFRDTWELEMDDFFTVHKASQCDADSEVVLATLTETSAGECAQRCVGYYHEDCSSFKTTTSETCILYKKCARETTIDEFNWVYVRKNFRTNYEPNNSTYVNIFEKSTCDKNGDNVLHVEYDDVLYSVHGCLDRCIQEGNDCEHFLIDSDQHCKIYSTCGGTGPVDQGTDPTVSDSDMTYSISTDTPAPTPQPTPPPTNAVECTSSTQCLEHDSHFCNNNGNCGNVTCTNHNDCYGHMLGGRLPMCDLKNDICVDLYESNCNSAKACRSRAKRKWRKQRAFAKTQVKNNQLKEENRRLASVRAIEELQQIAEVSADNVYIGVIGNETIEIDSTTVDLVNNTELLITKIIETYCGEASSECNYEIINSEGGRRMLADENATIVISYEIDDTLYNDLINSGYEFGSNNFTDALATSLGLDPEDVVIVSNNGNIDIEITIIDDVADGEPLSDDFIDDINNIQSQLNNITQDLAEEIDGDVTLDEVDFCGDRDCNGLGTCDPENGRCSCPISHIGVNCQTLIQCNLTVGFCKNGGTCPHDSFMCHCVFPYYGPECEYINTACDICNNS